MAQSVEDLLELARTELSEQELPEALPVLQGSDSLRLDADIEREPEGAAQVPEEKQVDIRTQLSRMSMAQRIKAAMFGNAIVRRLLVLDPNRLIQECVLNNPKLALPEVEEFARNPNMNAQLLRSISGRNHWMRSYKLKTNLVMNPKCPPDLSLRWLKFLNDNEVKAIARSKNIPQVLQLAAKKKLQEKK
jgi:hypothetical protein